MLGSPRRELRVCLCCDEVQHAKCEEALGESYDYAHTELPPPSKCGEVRARLLWDEAQHGKCEEALGESYE
jgi:hypothetical protein